MKLLILLFVLFISGCSMQESVEENYLSANIYDFYEVSNDVECNVLIGGGGYSGGRWADKSLCNNLGGGCVDSLYEGYYALSCPDGPASLCAAGKICQVTLSGCESAPAEWNCECGDPVEEDIHSICNVDGECVSVPGVGENQCSVNIDCLPESGCGDGIVEPYLFEECDGLDLNFESCISLGYSGGILGCNLDCTFNQNNCY
ncbi:hypothetical protein HN865_01585 [Candidatus Woesearchaeota archaeon]|jgi:hypothetical protein|nr:hypothetical protein [Candidatus Woesearchaeota archaeon]MBT7237528.1 hypothetical protein [Candidatus Woesearchaeota archaeon]